MAISSPSSPSLVPATQSSPGSVKVPAADLQKTNSDEAALWSKAGQAFANVQRQLDAIWRALQQAIPLPNPIQVTAADGSLIAEMGVLLDPTNNQSYSGIWGNNVYIGGTGPDTAQFVVTGAGTSFTITITGPSGTIVISAANPSIIATDASGDAVQILPGQISIVSGTNPSTQLNITAGELDLLNDTGATVVDIRSNPGAGEYGFINVVDPALSHAVTLDPSATSGLSTTGCDINTGGVFRHGGTAGISATVVLAKLTSLGSNGSITVTGGIITAYTAPT